MFKKPQILEPSGVYNQAWYSKEEIDKDFMKSPTEPLPKSTSNSLKNELEYLQHINSLFISRKNESYAGFNESFFLYIFPHNLVEINDVIPKIMDLKDRITILKGIHEKLLNKVKPDEIIIFKYVKFFEKIYMRVYISTIIYLMIQLKKKGASYSNSIKNNNLTISVVIEKEAEDIYNITITKSNKSFNLSINITDMTIKQEDNVFNFDFDFDSNIDLKRIVNVMFNNINSIFDSNGNITEKFQTIIGYYTKYIGKMYAYGSGKDTLKNNMKKINNNVNRKLKI